MGLAVIDRFVCATWAEDSLTLCRTCYDICPFKNEAIVLDQLRPVVREQACTGCGLCTHACPVTGKNQGKGINIIPLYAGINTEK
jgi:ferredoxin-type protein NapG